MKRGKKMLMLLLALVLCVGGYYGVQLLDSETVTVTEETGTFALDSHAGDELTSLAWTRDEESLSFTLTNGVWSVTSDPAFPLNQEDVQAMADDLLALTGTRQLDGVTDLASYGLSEPAFSVTASWSDGTTTTYAMCDETPFGDGYYLSLGRENIVYTVEEDIADIFDTTLNDLAVLDAIPTVANVTRLTVGETLDVVKEDVSRSINAGELWYDSITGEALDTSDVEALIDDAQALAWAELVNATASDDELTSYGVDEASAAAITLYDGETTVVTLLIGAQNDSGDYYARLPGSAMVFTVDSSDVSSLLTADAANMLSTTIIDAASENVQSATFTAGETSYAWQHATTDAAEETAESTEVEPDAIGEGLWASILALSAKERLTESGSGAVLLTVNISTKDGYSAVLTFTEYDADYYAASILDRAFLVDAADVDAIIRTLRANAK